MIVKYHGDIALSSLVYAGGFIIPTILGIIIWKESVTIVQVVGFLLLLFSYCLGASKVQGFKKLKKWLFFSISAMTCCGIVGFIQKVFSKSIHSGELNMLLLFAFAMMTVFSGILSIKEPKEKDKRAVFFAVILEITAGLAQKINLYLSGVLDSIVFYSSVNGGCVVLSAALGRIIFKEKMPPRKTMSVILGVIAIIMMTI